MSLRHGSSLALGGAGLGCPHVQEVSLAPVLDMPDLLITICSCTRCFIWPRYSQALGCTLGTRGASGAHDVILKVDAKVALICSLNVALSCDYVEAPVTLHVLGFSIFASLRCSSITEIFMCLWRIYFPTADVSAQKMLQVSKRPEIRISRCCDWRRTSFTFEIQSKDKSSESL